MVKLEAEDKAEDVGEETIEELRERKWIKCDMNLVVLQFKGKSGLQVELPDEYWEIDIMDLFMETNKYVAQHKPKLVKQKIDIATHTIARRWKGINDEDAEVFLHWCS